MSDSASRNDVEDVLSSVRRLVSSESPRIERAPLPEGPGALVLTDDHRVERKVSKGHAAKSLEDRISELEEAVSLQSDEYEPDGSEDQSEHRPDHIVYTRPPTAEEQSAANQKALRLSQLALVQTGGGIQAESGEETPSAPLPFGSDIPATPVAADEAPENVAEAPMAENVTPTDRPTAEVHPFHDPDDMVSRFEARIEGKDVPPAPVADQGSFAEQSEPFLSEPPEATEDTSAANSSEPSATAETPSEIQGELQSDEDISADAADAIGAEAFEAALSEAVAESMSGLEDTTVPPLDDVSEELQDEGSTNPEDVLEAVDASIPETSENTDAEADTSQTAEVSAAPITSAAAALSPELTEDVIRPIVAELIREELKGELGERITRNVRKLVRREILRIIDSREFE